MNCIAFEIFDDFVRYKGTKYPKSFTLEMIERIEAYKMDRNKLALKEFVKHDSGKVEYDMFPDSVLQDIVKVMMFGAKKYERDNWKKATDTTRYYNACRRHMESERSGEYLDADSGLPHLSHALCNLVFMHYLNEQKRKKESNVISPDPSNA